MRERRREEEREGRMERRRKEERRREREEGKRGQERGRDGEEARGRNYYWMFCHVCMLVSRSARVGRT